MASVNIEKFSKNNFKWMGSKHIDLEKRENLNHSNKDIDKTLTKQNYFYDCKNWDDIVNKLKYRLSKVKITVERKNTVAVCGCEIPVPDEIRKQGKADEFLKDAYNVLINKVGPKNVLGMAVHKDEQHKYIDSRTKETKVSLIHGHAFFVPVVIDEIENGKKIPRLNAKEKINRNFLRNLNKAMDDMCFEKYGVKYMTGTYKKGQSLSVEELKTQSLREEEKELKKSKNKYMELAKNYQEQAKKSKKEYKHYVKKVDDLVKRYTDFLEDLQHAELTADQIKELDLDLLYSTIQETIKDEFVQMSRKENVDRLKTLLYKSELFVNIAQRNDDILKDLKKQDKALKMKTKVQQCISEYPGFIEELAAETLKEYLTAKEIPGQMTIFDFMPNENDHDIR